MADTARSTDDDKREIVDSPEELEQKLDLLTQWIKESSQFIAFTGAGISTAAGIPDFRSGINTMLKTGPGAWELKKYKQARSTKHKTVSTTKAIPTMTHMSLVKLMETGHLKGLVSQNTDGLHRRSGIPPAKLFELHGNSNLETCKKCKRQYLRDFKVRNNKKVHSHETGRLCDNEKCRGALKDSIINFGESLPEPTLTNACKLGEGADLCLAMGSSLTVTPAADIPEEVGLRKNGRLVIVNLQPTPLDGCATLRINAMCDDVMAGVMKRLGLEAATFVLRRNVAVSETTQHGARFLSVQGRDVVGEVFSFVKSVDFAYKEKGSSVTKHIQKTKEPFSLRLPPNVASSSVTLTLSFLGHYKEPDFVIQHKLGGKEAKLYQLEYNPRTGVWTILNQEKKKPASTTTASGPSSSEDL
eukprot:m.122392 g.122392  ORF g.122392 m.122392 type:complete len:415 (+) comp23331_c0_seq1:447-1691(+)